MENRSIIEVQKRIRRKHFIKKWALAIVIYGIAIFYFFPILYMFLSGFKTEQQAVMPSIFFKPTKFFV